ncbi:hypothetical protein D3C76_854110 [compost metagenome]
MLSLACRSSSTAAMVSPPPQWLANLEFLTSALTSHSLLKSSLMFATLAGSSLTVAMSNTGSRCRWLTPLLARDFRWVTGTLSVSVSPRNLPRCSAGVESSLPVRSRTWAS